MFTWSKRPENQVLTGKAQEKVLHLRNEVRPRKLGTRWNTFFLRADCSNCKSWGGVIIKIQKTSNSHYIHIF